MFHVKNTQNLVFDLKTWYVFLKKFPTKVSTNSVIDEPLWSLGFSMSLVLENNIIIPPEIFEARDTEGGSQMTKRSHK